MTKGPVKLVQPIKDGDESHAAPERDDLAFMISELVQATLPHADPGNVPVWIRRNGRLTLRVRPYYDEQLQQHLHPYGTIPRLLMFWLTTEAVRTKSRILYPGDTLAEFMRELGLDPTRGGPRSDAHRLRDQMRRLFGATISFEVATGDAAAGSTERLHMPVVAYSKTWWDTGSAEQDASGSVIKLGEDLYKAITASSAPVSMRVLRAIKGSALALDLYAWVTYRAYTATQAGKTALVPWKELMGQLGANYSTTNDFQKKAAAALEKIKVKGGFPGIKINNRIGGIEIPPGASAAPPRRRQPKAPLLPPDKG